MNIHSHSYKLNCDMINGHNHKIHGIVENTIGLGGFHFHCFSGVSSYRNHTHYFSGFTGLAVKTENGHIHKMDGYLESNSSHEHKYSGYTSEEVSYISGKIYGEALTQ